MQVTKYFLEIKISVHWLFAGDFKCLIKEEIAITSGEWEVLGRHGSNVSLALASWIFCHTLQEMVPWRDQHKSINPMWF